MTTSKRIQRKRVKGWRRPKNAKIVDRTSRWGNPFRAKDSYTAEDAVALFEAYALQKLEEDPTWLEPLRGYDLLCYCKPGDPCHADVLLRLANAGDGALEG